jgi:hypothetical protein
MVSVCNHTSRTFPGVNAAEGQHWGARPCDFRSLGRNLIVMYSSMHKLGARHDGIMALGIVACDYDNKLQRKSAARPKPLGQQALQASQRILAPGDQPLMWRLVEMGVVNQMAKIRTTFSPEEERYINDNMLLQENRKKIMP